MEIWLVIIASAIWVFIDAKNIGVKKGLVPGMGNTGPWGWFFGTLMLWIVVFPMYLYYRGKFKLAIAANSTTQVSTPISGSVNTSKSHNMTIEDLEKLAALKEKGFITESEFQAKKKQLLGL